VSGSSSGVGKVAVTADSQPKIVSQEDGRPNDVVLVTFTKKKAISNYSFQKKSRPNNSAFQYLSHNKAKSYHLIFINKPSDLIIVIQLHYNR
jgi:hypothetical protein